MIETDWDRVFRPRSVALLGATGRADNPMARPLRWLAERGFSGSVWPVNPKYDELAGLPCFGSLDDVPGPVDLVLALVPAVRAEDAVRGAGAAGAAAVVVFASGFAEIGDDGADLQRRLVTAARESGVRVLGPNCQGLLYAPSRLFATFSAAAERPMKGGSGIAYVGQSGAIGGSVLDLAAEQGLELTAWVSTGNQADTDLTEIGRHLVRDPEISVLAVYAEAVADGAAYDRLAAEAAAAGTALVVLRSGRSDAGRRAAVSHTGAMLGDDTAFRLVSQRHGVVLVDDVEELLAAAVVLRGGVRPAGRRVAAVTTSGGAGILAADRCAAAGLALPELATETQAELARLVPAFGALANPVDVTAQLFNSGERAFGDVCSIVCADPSVDALMVLVTMVLDEDATALAPDGAAARGGGRGPGSVGWLAGRDRTAGARDVLRAAGIPVFTSIAAAARVAAALAPDPVPHGTPEPLPDVPATITDGWELLDALGVAIPASRFVHTGPEAAAAAAGLTRTARDTDGRAGTSTGARGTAVAAGSPVGSGPGGPPAAWEPGGPTAASEPGGPTVASEPGGPTVASEPGGPTVASEPGGPTVASEPGGPTVASEPGGPMAAGPRAAGGPGEPTAGAGPGGPSVVSGPGGPAVVGGTVVLKAVAPGLDHKTEHGGVRVGVAPEQVAAVVDEMAATVPGLSGVLVQQQVPGGVELLVGGRGGREGWPPLLTVGLGGTATELHGDVAVALAPVSRDRAHALLRQLRSWPLLDGYRGTPPLDVDAAVDAIVRIGVALAARPDVDELEVNPLIVGPDGATAVDVLLRLRPA